MKHLEYKGNKSDRCQISGVYYFLILVSPKHEYLDLLQHIKNNSVMEINAKFILE
jgi:hypothetical protein